VGRRTERDGRRGNQKTEGSSAENGGRAGQRTERNGRRGNQKTEGSGAGGRRGLLHPSSLAIVPMAQKKKKTGRAAVVGAVTEA